MHGTEREERRTTNRTRAAGLALAALAFGCGPAERAPAPDVILISLDTVRADELDLGRAQVAPGLERLARRGLVLERALAGSSWTLPSHAQLFTGQPPALHGVHTDLRRIDPLTPTLPELLRARGYFTAGVWSGWYLAGAYGFERGFERYECALEGAERIETGASVNRATERALFARRDRASHAAVSSERVVDLALAAVEAAPPDRPLFLFCHLFDPHHDYIPPPPFDALFDPDYEGDIDGRGYFENRRIYDPAKTPARQVGERDLQHLRSLYRGEIAWTDHALARLFETLERVGRLERALVILTSDHGEEFFEHEGRGHRRTLFEEVLRVPLVLVPPGAPERAEPLRSDALVSLADVLPTVLDYAGAPPARTAYGRSLRPLLEGGRLEPRAQVASLAFYRELEGGAPTYWLLEALHGGSHKLLRRTRLEPGVEPVLEFVELYDLERDPRELQPVRDRADPELRAAWQRLEAELERMRRFHRALPEAPPEERGTSVRRIFAPELAALGYAGEGGDEPGSELLGVEARPGIHGPLPALELR